MQEWKNKGRLTQKPLRDLGVQGLHQAEIVKI